MSRNFPNNAANFLAQSSRWADLGFLAAQGDGSVHWWSNLASTAGDQTFITTYQTGGHGILARINSGKLGVFWSDGFSGHEAIGATSLSTGRWTPMGFSYTNSGGTMRCFVDGAQDGSDTGGMHQLDNTWTVGRRVTGDNPLNGQMDRISMWRGVVLSAAQWAALARGVPPVLVEPRGLIEWEIDGLGASEAGSAPAVGYHNHLRPFVVTGTTVTSDRAPVAKGTGRGGGQSWTLDIDEDGSSLANFTADSGSWSIVGGVIQCNAAGGGTGRLRTNADQGAGWLFEWETELRILSASVADLSRAAIICHWDGTGGGATAVRLMWRTGSAERLEIEEDSVAGVAGKDYAFNLDQWYKICVQRNEGFQNDIYVDGVYELTGTVGAAGSNGLKLGLLAQNAIAEFRNIKLRRYVS